MVRTLLDQGRGSSLLVQQAVWLKVAVRWEGQQRAAAAMAEAAAAKEDSPATVMPESDTEGSTDVEMALRKEQEKKKAEADEAEEEAETDVEMGSVSVRVQVAWKLCDQHGLPRPPAPHAALRPYPSKRAAQRAVGRFRKKSRKRRGLSPRAP